MANFLIGRGELITEKMDPPNKFRRPGDEVYTFSAVKNRILPKLVKISEGMVDRNSRELPGNLDVIRVVMNPSYTARSNFPTRFLKEAGLNPIGSKNTRIKPEKWSKKKPVEETLTTEIFVSGTKDVLIELPNFIKSLDENSKVAKEFIHIEEISEILPEDKIKKGVLDNPKVMFFEIGLHIDDDKDLIYKKFKELVNELQGTVYDDCAIYTGSLCFVPIKIDNKKILDIAKFSMVRLIRNVSYLRELQPIRNITSIGVKCELPELPPLSTKPKVAILDGGIPHNHILENWLTKVHLGDEEANDIAELNQHGLGVTSAFLFGSLLPRTTALQPYSYVHHIRVLDDKTATDDPFELYRTLKLIQDVLVSKAYEFINLSLGPNLCVSDDDVHPWSSVIDQELSDGKTLLTVAAGNNGELDPNSGNNRIQIPSDSVNSLVVGASNSNKPNWEKACYSAVGPGRVPGRVKPDVVAFGGDVDEYFHVLSPDSSSTIAPTCGTSFAAPLVLRQAVGIRSILGEEITPIALKALLIHTANTNGHNQDLVGWGKIENNISKIIQCEDGEARILYQGYLEPGKYLKANIPLPETVKDGIVEITASLCFACDVDSEHSSAYTQSGLEITFRPHTDKFNKAGTAIETAPFFSNGGASNELERRLKEHKWETVLHKKKNKQASSLKNPFFEIHHIARENATLPKKPKAIPYAMVITVKSRKNMNLYNDILQTYVNRLSPLKPKVDISINL
ncbi:S8 family peptidase [Acinetobacter beijerinckii]|uniref:S8 family peptidase n=1 Tax=Acinetobacter beijerinckii TaxID=262668 RepID=UPI0005ED8D0E|nr:S8 family peptidase [Acinetobacter beijerinckii]